MPIDPSIIIAILSLALAVLTFFLGRQTAAKKSGQEWGMLLRDVKYIKDGMEEMKSNLGAEIQSLRREIVQERNDRHDSIRRLHDKIEDHVKEFHNGGKQ